MYIELSRVDRHQLSILVRTRCRVQANDAMLWSGVNISIEPDALNDGQGRPHVLYGAEKFVLLLTLGEAGFPLQ